MLKRVVDVSNKYEFYYEVWLILSVWWDQVI